MNERPPTTTHAGEHAIVDLFGVAHPRLVDCDGACDAFRAALSAAGMRILDERRAVFSNGGFTAFFLLAESHAAIHTYPERGFAALDILTCAGRPLSAAVQQLTTYFAPADSVMRTFERGRNATNARV